MPEETRKNLTDKVEGKEAAAPEIPAATKDVSAVVEGGEQDKRFHFEDKDIENIDRRNAEYKEARESRSKMGLSPEPESTVSEQQYLSDAEKYIETQRKDADFPIGTAVDFTMFLEEKPDREELVRKYPGREKDIDAYIQRLQGFDDNYKNGYVNTLTKNFNGASPEGTFQWVRMSHDGQTDYTQTDKVVDFLGDYPELQNNFRGHNVFWNRTKYLPDYLRGKPKEEIRREVMESRLEILKRYPSIKEWDLLNEPLSREQRPNKDGVNQDEVVFDPEKDFDFFVELFKRAKEVAPNAKFYVNEYSVLTGNQTGNYIRFIQKLIEAGAPVDGIGVQGHMFGEWDFASITQMKENLDDLAKLGLPIKITEFDVSNEAVKKIYFPQNAEGVSEQQLEEARADYLRKALTIFYGNPKVNGIFQWGFQDRSHWRALMNGEHCGLFDDNFRPNKVGETFQRLTQEKWGINVVNKNNS